MSTSHQFRTEGRRVTEAVTKLRKYCFAVPEKPVFWIEAESALAAFEEACRATQGRPALVDIAFGN